MLKPPGLETFEFVWGKRFCPLVIYTGFPEVIQNDPRLSHPFIKVVKKGSNSELHVVDKINEFKSHMEALDGVHKEIGVVINNALREVAPRIYSASPPPSDADDVLVRSARRRVAAAMDEALSSGSTIALREWEHYLYPALGGSLLTGDIIIVHGADPKDPRSYRVVLTPSCDLVADGVRKPKVGSVLVARCSDIQRVNKELPPELASPKAGKDGDPIRKAKQAVIRSMLTQGHGKTCLPLPALPMVFPTLVADLRDLELLDINTIYAEKPVFHRVASVDSPFRELVSWAYAICAARPGLPDRDYDAWLEQMLGSESVATKAS